MGCWVLMLLFWLCRRRQVMERATPAKRERDPPHADDDDAIDEERYTKVLEHR